MRTQRRAAAMAVAMTAVLATAACGGDSFDEDEGGDAGSTAGAGELTVLIASSGDAETEAVQAAADAWAEESGATVDVQVATDLQQQLAQGFAGGEPPDVFYVDAAQFANYAEAGNLEPYADQIDDNEDFYESLRQTFTYDGTQYCVPKDFSTLALNIRQDAWQAAGLTDADIPTTWEQLQSVAQRLTTGDQTGLVIGPTRDRVGAFMVQAGGWFVNEDATEATVDSPENVEALTYVQGLLQSGAAKYPSQVDAGWGGEAFGTGRAAMTIEGNWIRGAMRNDYPDVQYIVAELPEGPAGKGTLQFTQCWGVAADSDNKEQAVELIKSLTTVENQLAAAKAFGVMPSRQSAQEQYVAEFPDDAPFVAGGEYGQGPVNVPGVESVLSDFDAGLEAQQPPEQLLQTTQQNLSAVVGG
jgi:multiple sugar transport system substrate-binding protein